MVSGLVSVTRASSPMFMVLLDLLVTTSFISRASAICRDACMACCHDSCCSLAPPAETPNSPHWRRALWIALAVNAALFMAEIVAGAAAGSASLQADALDFFGDAANY